MADLTTLSGIDAELIATTRYAVNNDLDLAYRRLDALMVRTTTFASVASRNSQSLQFDMQNFREDLAKVEQFIRSAKTPTDAQRLANPSVTHADFSTIRG